MTTFTIDSENNITAHAGLPAGADDSQLFTNPKGTGETDRGLAGFPPGRYLEQLCGRGSLHGSEAGEEIHEPKGRDRPNLEGSRTSVPQRRATGGRRRAREGEAEEGRREGQTTRHGAPGREENRQSGARGQQESGGSGPDAAIARRFSRRDHGTDRMAAAHRARLRQRNADQEAGPSVESFRTEEKERYRIK